jgi:hypothetical protein
MRDCSWLLNNPDFGNLLPGSFKCSSDPTGHLPCWGYNCIAWAAGKTDKWWWPIADPCAFWPIPLDPKDPVSVAQFIKAFATERYAVCRHGRFENGYEKVAIFVDPSGEPTHAARLLPNGVWTSKMGRGEDIEHPALVVVEGRLYGTVKVFLKRRNPLCLRPNPVMKFLSSIPRFFEILSKRFSRLQSGNQIFS